MKKLKKPPTGWEDIFANHTPTTGLVSRIHKEFANKKTTRKKKKKKTTRTTTKNGQMIITDNSPKKICKWLKTHEKILKLNSQMPVKTTVGYHITPLRRPDCKRLSVI